MLRVAEGLSEHMYAFTPAMACVEGKMNSTSNKRLVSIGMPVYNSEQHIRCALESVLAQDYEHLEVIISDNASTDETEKICLEYAAFDARIRYYRNERNMGMAWNANRVWELSCGEYFKWAGSYDWMAPSFVSACKEILDTDPSVVLAYPLARLIDGKGETIRRVVPEIIDTRGLSTVARVLVVMEKAFYCALEFYGLFRTSALRRCRRLLPVIGNDHVLLLEMSLLGSIALVPEVLLHRRDLGWVLSEDERIATALMRLNPGASKHGRVRPHWNLGVQHLLGAWRLASLRRKIYLVPLVARTYYCRWNGQLKRELRRPYRLEEYKEPDF